MSLISDQNSILFPPEKESNKNYRASEQRFTTGTNRGVVPLIDCRSCLKELGKLPNWMSFPKIYSPGTSVSSVLRKSSIKLRLKEYPARSSGKISFPMKSSGENRANSAWERFRQIAFGWRMPTTKMEEPCDKCNINANRGTSYQNYQQVLRDPFFFLSCSSGQMFFRSIEGQGILEGLQWIVNSLGC